MQLYKTCNATCNIQWREHCIGQVMYSHSTRYTSFVQTLEELEAKDDMPPPANNGNSSVAGRNCPCPKNNNH